MASKEHASLLNVDEPLFQVITENFKKGFSFLCIKKLAVNLNM